MANGIEDLMNIRTTGGTQNVPPRPPMNPMQGGLASMGAGQPTMPPVVEEQRAMPPMGGQEMPSERPQEPVSTEQDGAALAQAVVGRAQGDIGAAVAILDTAKAMLMQSGQEDPMMMMGGGPLYREDGGPMYANMGRPLYREDGGKLNPGLQALQKTNPEVVDKIMGKNMGGPLYAQEGTPITDTETMKQMIMNSISDMNNIIEKTDDIGIDPSVSSISNFNELAKKYRITTGKDVPADFYNEGSVGKDAQQAANAAIAYQMSLR